MNTVHKNKINTIVSCIINSIKHNPQRMLDDLLKLNNIYDNIIDNINNTTDDIDEAKLMIVNIYYRILYTIGLHSNCDILINLQLNVYILFHTMLLSVSYTMYCQMINKLIDFYPTDHASRWLLTSPLLHNTQHLLFSNIDIDANQPTMIVRIISYLTAICTFKLDIQKTNYEQFYNTLLNISQPRSTKHGTINGIDIGIIGFVISLSYHTGPPNAQRFDTTIHAACKRLLSDYFKKLYLQHMPPRISVSTKSVAIILCNPHTYSSDFLGNVSFFKALRELGYKLTLVHNTMEEKEEFLTYYDDKIHLRDNMPQTICNVASMNFDIAIYGSQFTILTTVLTPLRLGKIQISTLGTLITSGLPDMDYFITPRWDNECNYTEKLIKLSGMGCSIPLDKLKVTDTAHSEQLTDFIESTKLLINNKCVVVVLVTGAKLNTKIGPLMEIINNKATNKIHYIVCIGTGCDKYVKNALQSLHFDPYDVNYTMVSDNISLYEYYISVCDYILCPFPYEPYISLIDSFKINKPSVALCDISYNSSCCAAKMLEIMHLHECVAYTKNEYIDLAVRFADDIAFRQLCSEKMRYTNFVKIIESHNLSLENEFKEWIINNV